MGELAKPTQGRTSTSRNVKPYEHVMSLGARCLMSDTLLTEGFRNYAGPFDWIYTNMDMVVDCIRDDFKKFLDLKLLKGAGAGYKVQVGHKVYGPMINRDIVFPHHDPRSADRERFQRSTSRLLNILQLKLRKLFCFCDLVKSQRALDEFRGTDGAGEKVKQLFDAMQAKGVKNFELVVIAICTGSASAARGSPLVRRHAIVQDVKTCRLQVQELHCVGACTGLKFKQKADSKTLGAIIREGRKFAIRADPGPRIQDARRFLKRPAASTMEVTDKRKIRRRD